MLTHIQEQYERQGVFRRGVTYLPGGAYAQCPVVSSAQRSIVMSESVEDWQKGEQVDL